MAASAHGDDTRHDGRLPTEQGARGQGRAHDGHHGGLSGQSTLDGTSMPGVRLTRRMLALVLGVVATGALLATSGAISFLRAEQRRLVRARRAARGETELRIVNSAGAALALKATSISSS
jgi:hypothetical protein